MMCSCELLEYVHTANGGAAWRHSGAGQFEVAHRSGDPERPAWRWRGICPQCGDEVGFRKEDGEPYVIFSEARGQIHPAESHQAVFQRNAELAANGPAAVQVEEKSEAMTNDRALEIMGGASQYQPQPTPTDQEITCPEITCGIYRDGKNWQPFKVIGAEVIDASAAYRRPGEANAYAEGLRQGWEQGWYAGAFSR
jgi:hypothetical protein